MRRHRATLTLSAAFLVAWLTIHLALSAGGPEWLAALVGAAACWVVFAAAEHAYLRQRAHEVALRLHGAHRGSWTPRSR